MNAAEYEASRALSKCKICGIVYRDHARCSVCGILTGPLHLEGELHRLNNGKLACASCKELKDN